MTNVPSQPLPVQPDSSADHDLSDGAIPTEPNADRAADDTTASNQEDAGSAGSGVDPLVLEALLMGTHHPMTGARLVDLTAAAGVRAIRQAVTVLNDVYEKTGRAFRIEQVAGGYQMLTLPQFGEHLKRLHQHEADAKLTKAALETLAIIAYKQPILRADLEAIRGVASGETIRSLMEKHLVKIAGRAELPGRPILYGTTKRFLELFGLNTLKDLPMSESGVAPLRPAPARKTDPEQPAV
jgi:segregation and condensation protein B